MDVEKLFGLLNSFIRSIFDNGDVDRIKFQNSNIVLEYNRNFLDIDYVALGFGASAETVTRSMMLAGAPVITEEIDVNKV